jgi:hypothetical protein
MADRAAKRMRRLSTENEDSEAADEWMNGNNRYVADCNTHSSRQGQAGVQGLLEQQSRPHTAPSKGQLPLCLHHHACATPSTPAPPRPRLTPLQSFLCPLKHRLTRLPLLHTTRHAPSTCAPAASSPSDSSQCPHSLLDPPATRHRQPVARRRRHPALLTRRDAPVHPPHREIVARQAATSHQRRCFEVWSGQTEHRRRLARVADQ